MKTFVVGICNLFDNITKLYKVQAENEVEAMKIALIDNCSEEHKSDQIIWNKTIGETVKDIQNQCFGGDTSISNPLEV